MPWVFDDFLLNLRLDASVLHRLLPTAALFATLVAAALPAQANETAIRKAIAERMPNAPKIDEIRPAPMPGLWEIRIGNEIRYIDPTGTFLIEGELIDLKAKKNLTEERVTQLNRIDFASLPLKDAVVWKTGTGKRRIAVFADPNCGYCKRFEADLQKVDNITVYMFLYPILSKDSADKSKAIWCAKDRSKAWFDLMLKNVSPIMMGNCDTAVLQRNLELGQKLGISGTPTSFMRTGQRIVGARSSDIRKLVEVAKN